MRLWLALDLICGSGERVESSKKSTFHSRPSFFDRTIHSALQQQQRLQQEVQSNHTSYQTSQEARERGR